ncbi:hypothetical protein O181_039934 [Austropuccinia psidii MF-1]|uniref:Uncharacterized protein n=1 Tax=Austropuccinia psidii MF-1 TaxID=1389203 RepID=A0A9Q3DBF0_9BASI|nr:hypothetical protein [Austropuccinia psidii MF-1]
MSFKYIKVPKKLKDSFAGPFIVRAICGPNAVQLQFTGESMKKDPDLPISLMKPYISDDIELFSIRNKPTLEITPLEEGEENEIVNLLKERRKRNKKEREYLIRQRNPSQEDGMILKKDMTNADKLFRTFRHERRPKERKVNYY